MADEVDRFSSLDRSGRVRQALIGLVHREAEDGNRWCPPLVARKLIQVMALRGYGLVSLTQGAVRLARLLAHTGRGDIINVLFRRESAAGGIAKLRVATFQGLIKTAAELGHLPADRFEVGPSGVSCLEPHLATRAQDQHRPAHLPFHAMPLQAGFLILACEALGHDGVIRLLAPLLDQGPPVAPAYGIANALRAEFDAWLTANLSSSHHMRQHAAILADLPEHLRRRPELIDDEAILDFWRAGAQHHGSSSRNEFRVFKTLARKLIAIRHLARLAAIEATSMDNDEGAGDEPSATPLAALMSPPANKVRWLMRTEVAELANFLGDVVLASQDVDGHTQKPFPRGLGASGTYDLSLWRTLLRADALECIQGRITQLVRDGIGPAEALLLGLKGARPPIYAERRSRYGELNELIGNLVYIVASEIAGPETARLSLAQREELASSQQKAKRAVQRSGLDLDRSPQNRDAYHAAAEPLASIMGSLEALLRVLASQPLESVAARDLEIFLDVLTRLYVDDADPRRSAAPCPVKNRT